MFNILRQSQFWWRRIGQKQLAYQTSVILDDERNDYNEVDYKNIDWIEIENEQEEADDLLKQHPETDQQPVTTQIKYLGQVEVRWSKYKKWWSGRWLEIKRPTMVLPPLSSHFFLQVTNYG